MSAALTIRIPMWLDFIFAWPVLFYRRFKYGYSFRRLYLGDGLYTILDQQDYRRFAGFRWFARCEQNTFYVYRLLNISGKRSKLISLHREILNAPKGLFVDHQNCFGFDNRRANLRLATRTQNNCNKRKRKNTSSRFIGVSIHKHSNRWRAYISYKGKKIYLGYFDDEIEAAKAYDAAAKIYHTGFARLNFPDDSSSPGYFCRLSLWSLSAPAKRSVEGCPLRSPRACLRVVFALAKVAEAVFSVLRKMLRGWLKNMKPLWLMCIISRKKYLSQIFSCWFPATACAAVLILSSNAPLRRKPKNLNLTPVFSETSSIGNPCQSAESAIKIVNRKSKIGNRQSTIP